MSDEKRWIVVGVSGVTCGGKSTFAAALQAAFPAAIVISQDDYFLPSGDPQHTRIASLNHINWEIASALDMDKMISDIQKILSRQTPRVDSPLVIIEGFLIFTDPYISSLCDHKYVFTVPPEVSQARRAARASDTSDREWNDVPGYFEQVVWLEYERHLQEAFTINSDLVLVDGTRDTQSIVHQVSSTIRETLNRNK